MTLDTFRSPGLQLYVRRHRAACSRCTYAVHEPVSGVPYVPCAVEPQVMLRGVITSVPAPQATGRMGVSLAGLAGLNDAAFAQRRAASRLQEMIDDDPKP